MHLRSIIFSLVFCFLSLEVFAKDEAPAVPASQPPATAPVANAPETTLPPHFNEPLYFSPQDNRVSITSPQLKWIIDDQKNLFQISGVNFEGKDLLVRASLAARGDGTLAVNLGITWPKQMGTPDKIFALGDDEKEIWSIIPTEKQMRSWQEFAADEAQKKTPWVERLRDMRLGFVDANVNEMTFLKDGATFRLCTRRAETEGLAMTACSPLYKTQRSDRGIKLLVEKPQKGIVKVNGVDYGSPGIVNTEVGIDLAFDVLFPNRAELKFNTHPQIVRILDVSWGPSRQTIVVTGSGGKPMGVTKDIKHANHVGESYWEYEIVATKPLIQVQGPWEIPFLFLIDFHELPSANDRVFISDRVGESSYSSRPRISLYTPSGSKVTGSELEVTEEPGAETGKKYLWVFNSPNKAQVNRATVDVQSADEKSGHQIWKASESIYRADAFDVAARFTGAFNGSNFIPTGELQAQAWLENVGSDDYWFSLRRWGASFDIAEAFSSVAVSSVQSLSPYQTFNFDLRYNIIPGVWNHDFLFGVAPSYMNFTLGSYVASVAGAGGYLAFATPRWVDWVFNLIPFFRYPKYLDLQAAYYFMSLDPSVTVGSTFTASAHGKIFWKPNFYGDVGVGFKNFDVTNSKQLAEVKFGNSYISLGLGYTF